MDKSMMYLVVEVNRGMTSKVDQFSSLREAKRAFREIALGYRYRPSEINGSDYYHVSIWEWTGERYEDINYYP